MTDMIVNHLTGEMGVTEKIKKAMFESAKQFVYIGFLLKEVRDYKYYEEGGYESVYAYAEFELGFKKSSTKNFIAIAENFGVQKYTYQGIRRESQTMSLQQEYKEFNYSQLVELLAMSDTQRAKAKPDMTIKQLREIKRQPEEANQIEFDTLDKLIATGQTSGQQSIQVHDGMQETNIGKPLAQVGLPVDSKINASLKEETIQNLCEIACMKFNKNKRYHIVIYAEK